jgi:hypothetical protein
MRHPVQALVRFLRSAALARAVLLYLAALCGVAAWLPWVQATAGDPHAPAPPGWAVAVGLDHPFSSPWLLAGVGLLFASTLACTWGKRARIAALWRGELPSSALRLAGGADPAAFLRAQGFRGEGPLLFRHRLALWGGLVLHWGLLALIAGVGAQQAFHDEGFFQLAPGELRRLDAPESVFGRVAGPLAPAAPPALEVALEAFDPFRHQPGYAPDRLSTLMLRPLGGQETRAEVDRADGVRVGSTRVYQAIPMGLAVVVETHDRQRFALHLATVDRNTSAAEARDAAGRVTRLVATAERGLEDPAGTGAIAARLEQGGRALPLEPGQVFSFGGTPLRVVEWTRWSGFSYARSPGMPAVFAGFLLVLLGAALLALPAGVARLEGPGGEAASVWQARGGEALRREWEQGAEPR